MKNAKIIEFPSKKSARYQDIDDVDLLLNIKLLINQIEEDKVREALLHCWKEQAYRKGLRGLGV